MKKGINLGLLSLFLLSITSFSAKANNLNVPENVKKIAKGSPAVFLNVVDFSGKKLVLFKAQRYR